MGKRTRAVIMVAALAATGCREGSTFDPKLPDEPADPALVRLTYSDGLEQNPVWSRNSDSVYYSASRFVDKPALPGILLGIPRMGGVAHLLLPDAQLRNFDWHVLPALSPAGDRVAFVQLARVLLPAACVRIPPTEPPQDCAIAEPLLDSAVLRVRDIAGGGLTERGNIPFRFPGTDPERALDGLGTFTQQLYPFQDAYVGESSLLFRPSWSPDGQRLVFSNGMQLFLWTVGTASATPIPNTADGVSPAWSPDGSTIAFARLLRGDSTTVSCSCTPANADKPQTHTRTSYRVARRAVTTIRPDGTDVLDVTTGEEPAWSPDGATLYFRNDTDIYRVPRAGGAPVKILNTFNGRSPAVSPDGKWLAFSRRPAGPNPDISVWVVSLAGQ
jgi:Tol biopolymer transport system component